MTEATARPRRTAPIPYRSPRVRCGWQLPGGAQLAVWVINNVEFFPLDENVPGGTAQPPDVLAYSMRDYGGRVGFWRIFDALEEQAVPTTVALNTEVHDVYPEVVNAMVESGHELMGHCNTNNRRLSEMTADEEFATIATATRRITEATGSAPRGWLGAGLQERWTTLERLDAHGYSYVGDWVNDDRPNSIDDTRLTALPYSAEINDKTALDTWKMSSEDFVAMARRQFDVLFREGAHEPRVFALALHPYLFGVPHRIDALRSLLETLRSREGVWWATGSEIADCYQRSTAGVAPVSHRPST